MMLEINEWVVGVTLLVLIFGAALWGAHVSTLNDRIRELEDQLYQKGRKRNSS